jgi:SanA protein
MGKRIRYLYYSVGILLILTFFSLYFCNDIIKDSAKGKLYSDISSIPYNKVGLLLGTSKYLYNGIENPYYLYRIDAATQLLKAGKIKYVIISGDNGHINYNEPKSMRTDLINSGIDSANIYLDFAGFRTFDSMIRLREIFGQNAVTVISQRFHNERAIYIASKENIAAIGFNATDLNNSNGLKIQIREKFARVKVFLDFLFGTKPKFLGEKIQIK